MVLTRHFFLLSHRNLGKKERKNKVDSFFLRLGLLVAKELLLWKIEQVPRKKREDNCQATIYCFFGGVGGGAKKRLRGTNMKRGVTGKWQQSDKCVVSRCLNGGVLSSAK